MVSDETLRRVRHIGAFVRPQAAQLTALFVVMIASTCLGLVSPYLMKVVVDAAIPKGNTRLLTLMIGAMFAASLFGFLLSLVTGYWHTKVTSEILFNLRRHVFNHVQKLSMSFFTSHKVGDILSRIGGDVAEVQGIFTGAAFGFTSGVLTLVGTAGVLAWMNWRLLLAGCALLPLCLLTATCFRRSLVELTERSREKNAELGSLLVEGLTAMKVVKCFGAERSQLLRFESTTRDIIKLTLRSTLVSTSAGGLPALVVATASLLVLWYGSNMVIARALSLGELVAFVSYIGKVFGPAQGLVGLYLRLQQAGVCLGRVFELLDEKPEFHQGSDGIKLQRIRGDLRFKGVRFSFDGGPPILAHVTFRVPSERKTVILGASGVGKTTLLDLLFRFYDPEEGAISLDGHDLRSLDPEWLRQQIAVVTQEPFLFHASIRENLQLARPGAELRELTAAARAAGIGTFIETLPEGYETMVGERGTRLSAGERQRITIARALLRDAPILILDEATASIDWETERKVDRALKQLMRGRTTIMVTHRLASALEADWVVMLEQGEVVEEGAPLTLLRTEGPFARLCTNHSDVPLTFRVRNTPKPTHASLKPAPSAEVRAI